MNGNLNGLKNAQVIVDEVKYDCIEIVKLDEGSVNENKDDKNLAFTTPFCSLFLGPSRSGKTTTWINMLKNKDLLLHRFEEIYYFIPTWNEDPIYDQNLLVDPKHIILDYDPVFTKAIIDGKRLFVENHLAQEENMNKSVDGLLPNCLFIVDDNVGTRELGSRMFTTLDILATRGRKYNISLIIAAQYLKGVISTIVRSNLTDICIYFLPNSDVQKGVLEEFKGTVSLNEARAMYNKCFEGGETQKHNFFYIQNFNTNINTKYRKNLNTFLIPRTEEKTRLLPLKRGGKTQLDNLNVNKKIKVEEKPTQQKVSSLSDKKEKKEEEKAQNLQGIKKKHMGEFLESRRNFIEDWVNKSYESGYVDDVSMEDWNKANPELHLQVTTDKLKSIDDTFLRDYVRNIIPNYEYDEFFTSGLLSFLRNGNLYDNYERQHKNYDTQIKVFDKTKWNYETNEALRDNFKYSDLPIQSTYIPQIHDTNQSEPVNDIYSAWMAKEKMLQTHNKKESAEEFLELYNPKLR